MVLHNQFINRASALKCCSCSRAGFTLFEVVLSMGLLSMVYALTVPSVFQLLQEHYVRQAYLEGVYTVHTARVLAVSKGWHEEIQVRIEPHIMWVLSQDSAVQSYSFPLGIVAVHAPQLIQLLSDGSVAGDRGIELSHFGDVMSFTVEEGGVIVQ